MIMWRHYHLNRSVPLPQIFDLCPCPMMRSIQRASGVDLYTYSLSACHCCGSAVCAMILSGWDPSVPLLNLYA